MEPVRGCGKHGRTDCRTTVLAPEALDLPWGARRAGIRHAGPNPQHLPLQLVRQVLLRHAARRLLLPQCGVRRGSPAAGVSGQEAAGGGELRVETEGVGQSY